MQTLWPHPTAAESKSAFYSASHGSYKHTKVCEEQLELSFLETGELESLSSSFPPSLILTPILPRLRAANSLSLTLTTGQELSGRAVPQSGGSGTVSACAGYWNGEGRVHSGKAQKAMMCDVYTVLNVRSSWEFFHFRTCQLFPNSLPLLCSWILLLASVSPWGIGLSHLVPGASSQPFPCLSLRV